MAPSRYKTGDSPRDDLSFAIGWLEGEPFKGDMLSDSKFGDMQNVPLLCIPIPLDDRGCFSEVLM